MKYLFKITFKQVSRILEQSLKLEFFQTMTHDAVI